MSQWGWQIRKKDRNRSENGVICKEKKNDWRRCERKYKDILSNSENFSINW